MRHRPFSAAVLLVAENRVDDVCLLLDRAFLRLVIVELFLPYFDHVHRGIASVVVELLIAVAVASKEELRPIDGQHAEDALLFRVLLGALFPLSDFLSVKLTRRSLVEGKKSGSLPWCDFGRRGWRQTRRLVLRIVFCN